MYDFSMFMDALGEYVDLKIRAANMGSLSDVTSEQLYEVVKRMAWAANGPSGDDE